MKSAAVGLALLLVTGSGCGGEAPSDEEVIVRSDSAAAEETAPVDDTGVLVEDTGTVTTDTGSEPADATPDVGTPSTHVVRYVWVIVMENHNWSSIKGKSSAPYINKLLTEYAHAEQYFNPTKNHPSEPNYIWMEAGDNLGITNDNDPSSNHKATTDHLVTKLQAAGISWKSYQEDIDGTKCPLTSVNLYAPKHNPMLYFDDVTNANSSTSANCIAHVRPYEDLFLDAEAGKVPRYSFVTPNLCNDMHGQTFGTKCNSTFTDMVKKGDTWLSTEVPRIMALPEYKSAGAIFITWDEGEGLLSPSDGPIGMIVVSPFAKNNYSNTIKYTHSSLLRTVQTIFDVTPFIRAAATATDLSDLFATGP